MRENTVLVDKTTGTIGAAANGRGDVKDITTLAYQCDSTLLHLVKVQVSQASKAVYSVNQLKRGSRAQGRRRMQVSLISTPEDGVKGSATVVCSTDAFHACGQTCRLRGNTKSGSLARELNAVNINFEAACTSTPEQCGRKGVKGAC